MSSRSLALAMALSATIAAGTLAQSHAAPNDHTVVLIVADGLRWQEIFTGADSTLMSSAHGGIWADSTVLHK